MTISNIPKLRLTLALLFVVQITVAYFLSRTSMRLYSFWEISLSMLAFNVVLFQLIGRYLNFFEIKEQGEILNIFTAKFPYFLSIRKARYEYPKTRLNEVKIIREHQKKRLYLYFDNSSGRRIVKLNVSSLSKEKTQDMLGHLNKIIHKNEKKALLHSVLQH